MNLERWGKEGVKERVDAGIAVSQHVRPDLEMFSKMYITWKIYKMFIKIYVKIHIKMYRIYISEHERPNLEVKGKYCDGAR